MALIFKNKAIYLGRYPFKTKANAFTLDYGVDEKDVTHLSTDTSLAFPGIMTVGANIKGFMDIGDPTTGDFVEDIINSNVGNVVSAPILVAHKAGVDGERCFFFRSYQITGNRMSGSIGDVHPFEFKVAPAASRLAAGKIALPELLRAGATGNGTGYQLGVLATGQKLYVSLHVLSVTSGGSVVIKIQSDDNGGFSTPTDRITFTAFTARTEDWQELAGPIATDDRWRATWTRTGGTDFNAVVAFGIGPA